jgi:spore coat polysaccharide biosynthesis protein SpsF
VAERTRTVIAAIVQARMSSERFPGKVLEPILGRSMLACQLERIAAAGLDAVVVATSRLPEDDRVAECAAECGVRCYRGSLSDVLDRYFRAARTVAADHVVRLTADCPLSDPRLVERVVDLHLAEGNDYTSNTLEKTFPDGMDVEVLSLDALARVWNEATLEEDREHVTSFVHRHAETFKLGSLGHCRDLSGLRWTVDFPADLALVREIYRALYSRGALFSFEDVAALFEARPELAALNGAHNAHYRELVRPSAGGDRL